MVRCVTLLTNSRRRLLLLLPLLFTLILINWASIHENLFSDHGLTKSRSSLDSVNVDANLYQEADYSNKISSDRLNTLFNVLKEKESVYEEILKNFNLLSFSQFVNQKEISPEYKDYLQVKGSSVVATEYFVKYLKTKSHLQTETNSLYRDISTHRELTEVNLFDN